MLCSCVNRFFLLEQQVTCEDLDGLDKQAYHLLGFNDGEMVAYARVLPLGVYAEGVVSLGRLLIVKKLRWLWVWKGINARSATLYC